MRSRAAGKLFREAVIAIELVIVRVEAHALVLLLQFFDKDGDAIKLTLLHLNIFRFPSRADDVVHGFGVQEEATLIAILGERGQVF